jgi:group I intron endonuclease
MKLDIKNFGDIHKTGVYKITNTVNSKIYIGSTRDSFKARWKNHIVKLRAGTHPNKYLQSSFNKHKESVFEFTVVEIIEDNNSILDREQFYLDLYQCYNKNIGYNQEIKVFKSEISAEVKLKISKTLKEKYKSGELTPKNPLRKGNIPWNKGLKCNNISKRRREISDSIAVYNLNLDLVAIFRSCVDLEEWSIGNKIPNMIFTSCNKKGSLLRKDKIYLSIRNNTPYKGLHFKKHEPLLPEMGVVKWMNSGEVCDDNPEPSL